MTTETQTVQEKAAEALACFEVAIRDKDGAHIVRALMEAVADRRERDDPRSGIELDAQRWLDSDQDREAYWRVKEGSPSWITDLCHAAHQDGTWGGMLPDDWRYGFIEEALRIITDCDERDLLDEQVDMHLEPSIYTADLLAWLSSNLSRAGYCDEAFAEGLASGEKGIINLIAYGQLQEKREVLGLVLEFLRTA